MSESRIRTTISLDPEVYSVFLKMAEASGTSVSRCMGDWLADTVDGAQFVASKMQEARKAPRLVMREALAAAKGLTAEVEQAMAQMRAAGGRPGKQPAASRAAEGGPLPPSSPTGVKSPALGRPRGRKAA